MINKFNINKKINMSYNLFEKNYSIQRKVKLMRCFLGCLDLGI